MMGVRWDIGDAAQGVVLGQIPEGLEVLEDQIPLWIYAAFKLRMAKLKQSRRSPIWEMRLQGNTLV